MTMQTIYQILEAMGVPLNSHESDLYAKRCPESTELLKTYQFRGNVTTFRSNIDGTLWYDIPFAFDPFWEKRESL